MATDDSNEMVVDSGSTLVDGFMDDSNDERMMVEASVAFGSGKGTNSTGGAVG